MFKKILISLVVSGTCLSMNAQAADCKRKSMTEDQLFELTLATRMNNADVVKKMLVDDCLSPNQKSPDYSGVGYPIFEVASYKILEYYLKAGVDLSIKNSHNRGVMENAFAYDRSYIYTSQFAKFVKDDILSFADKANFKYLKKEDVDKYDFSKLNPDQEDYEKFLKYFIATNERTISKPFYINDAQRNDLTVFHYLAYNGLADTFEFAINKELMFNPNLKNGKGQPILSAVLNHSCSLDKKGTEGVFKIFNNLVSNKKTNMKEYFVLNFDRSQSKEGYITYKDLLSNYKKRGNPKVYEAMVKVLNDKQSEFFTSYSSSNFVPNKKIDTDSMKTFYCENINKDLNVKSWTIDD